MKNNNVVWQVTVEDKSDDAPKMSYWVRGGTIEQAIKKALAKAKKERLDNTFFDSKLGNLRVSHVEIAGTIDID